MSKKEMSVYGWCKRACSYVRHPHDRSEVMRELEGRTVYSETYIYGEGE